VRGFKIILVGRVRKGFRKEAFDYYLKKIRHYTRPEISIIKDIKENNVPLRLEKEAGLILERITPGDRVIALDENGRTLSSMDFCTRFAGWDEDPGSVPCFVIGGAYGLSEKIRSRADLLMSLGPMTLPHELAAVFLMEQLYRAQTILKGHPYHH
jgi:23S rRNA (pseudouridine1915-N3)-methyltransferase